MLYRLSVKEGLVALSSPVIINAFTLYLPGFFYKINNIIIKIKFICNNNNESGVNLLTWIWLAVVNFKAIPQSHSFKSNLCFNWTRFSHNQQEDLAGFRGSCTVGSCSLCGPCRPLQPSWIVMNTSCKMSTVVGVLGKPNLHSYSIKIYYIATRELWKLQFDKDSSMIIYG